MTLWGERVELDDETESDHFENIQSTNWQTLRFKPPPPNSPIGWRVEFRIGCKKILKISGNFLNIRVNSILR